MAANDAWEMMINRVLVKVSCSIIYVRNLYGRHLPKYLPYKFFENDICGFGYLTRFFNVNIKSTS